MIAQLRGQIVEQNANQLILDVHGVGYLITVSSFTLTRINRETGDISLLIENIFYSCSIRDWISIFVVTVRVFN